MPPRSYLSCPSGEDAADNTRQTIQKTIQKTPLRTGSPLTKTELTFFNITLTYYSQDVNRLFKEFGFEVSVD